MPEVYCSIINPSDHTPVQFASAERRGTSGEIGERATGWKHRQLPLGELRVSYLVVGRRGPQLEDEAVPVRGYSPDGINLSHSHHHRLRVNRLASDIFVHGWRCPRTTRRARTIKKGTGGAETVLGYRNSGSDTPRKESFETWRRTSREEIGWHNEIKRRISNDGREPDQHQRPGACAIRRVGQASANSPDDPTRCLACRPVSSSQRRGNHVLDWRHRVYREGEDP